MRDTDWWWWIFVGVWAISSLLDIVDFSVQIGDKNQVTIEKVNKEKKEPEKVESKEIKAD